ncbi:ATP-binding protein ABC transporter [Mycobacterium ulcerans Agy99]|uniref:ATP-binding protein ABC transporter n=1 Tax=Mycobacterium ulcerans (strain Agy99) TaxID=362242 RepID=A0PTQ3_MYCUA|nr:ATP-binding protein ABC transporter [Mycobacterium ulcerans Agy99]
MRRSQSAVEVIDLVKRRGSVTAVDGISFAVPQGGILGLLGPNGAGKTTTVRMVATLTRPTSGTAWVAGHDVCTAPESVRREIGLTCQEATLDGLLTARENINMIGSLRGIRRKELASLSDRLLDQFSIAEFADRRVDTYSGGMRRRLDVAISLLARPQVLFLDEPTAGLDPHSRIQLWEVLGTLVDDGPTLVLTTQYLEEADRLADNIVLIDKGRVIAEGSPFELKQKAGDASIVVTVSRTEDVANVAAFLRTGVKEVRVDICARRITVATHGLLDLSEVARMLHHYAAPVEDIRLARPSLDDVFVLLTGHHSSSSEGDGRLGAWPALVAGSAEHARGVRSCARSGRGVLWRSSTLHQLCCGETGNRLARVRWGWRVGLSAGLRRRTRRGRRAPRNRAASTGLGGLTRVRRRW